MIDKDKYQYLLSEIHELNREKLFVDQENNEKILNELDNILLKLNNHSDKKEPINKILSIVLILSIVNLIAIFFLILYINFKINDNEKIDNLVAVPQVSIISIEDNSNIKSKKEEGDVVIFEGDVKFDENFVTVTPIIKKDTKYKCEDDGNQATYRIPYKTEIKGKLYSDRFEFILQQDKNTKKCNINKNDM